MAAISIIVPVFNVEKYLDRCISSLINQSFTDLEIILVDDGSTDSSPEMCESWALRDDRIKVIHKKNGGLGFARNSGLEIATGTLVSFVDSDDYLDKETYQKLYRRMTESEADICYFGCNYDHDGNITFGSDTFPEDTFNKDKIIKELLPISFGTSITKDSDPFGIGSVCCGIYNRDLFEKNQLRFGSEREVLCEDILFTSILLTNSSRVVFLNENLYYYCYNGSSLTHTYRADRFEKSQKFYELQNDVIDQNSLGDKARLRSKYSFLINTIVCLKQEASRDARFTEKRKSILKIANSPVFRSTYKSIAASTLNLKKRLLFGSLYLRFVDFTYLLVALSH